jgi:ornithine cyclodeaminase
VYSIDARAVEAATPFPTLIDALAEAFREPAAAPLRSHMAMPNADGSSGTLLVMPCSRPGGRFGLKLATVSPGNAAHSLPTVQATYVLGTTDTGSFDAIMDGTQLTLRRTAATSALASRLLSREDSRRLLLVGAGSMAGPLALAHSAVRPIEEVRIWNRSSSRAAQLCERLQQDHGLSASVANDLESAAAWADIISCATTSADPLVLGRHLRPGQHIDLVGAYTPAMRETDDDAIRKARVFVDDRAAALSEAGDLIQPLRAGAITEKHILAEMRQLVRGEACGRQARPEITLFKSVGLALEDLAAAELVLSAMAAGAGARS